MTTLAISAPQPNIGTITCAGSTRIPSLPAGSMIRLKSTAPKLAAAPLPAQAGTGLPGQPIGPWHAVQAKDISMLAEPELACATSSA
jgi:hypothetical protein